MRQVSIETLSKIGELAVSGLTIENYESAVADLVGDPDLARRIIDWLPEAFGLVLIGHMGDVTLPKTFRAKDRSGKWIELPFSREPIFADALDFASLTYHNGPKHLFSGLAVQSSVVDTVNKTLNAGESLTGARLGPITMTGLSAETYDGMV
ncbi:hypothetical protein [Hydrocarboniphaga effusa]|uniref:hypothetical protein n=1 Tax=Hydrocarboniphaga effusa TaxID=243629 RepID=UPI003BAA8BC1